MSTNCVPSDLATLLSQYKVMTYHNLDTGRDEGLVFVKLGEEDSTGELVRCTGGDGDHVPDFDTPPSTTSPVPPSTPVPVSISTPVHVSSNLPQTPIITHLTNFINDTEENITSSFTDLTIATSDTSFPSHLCLIIFQCPLLATLIESVPPLLLDSPTILLPQFSSSSVKCLLSLFYTGQCPLSDACGLEEIKQVMEAVGLKVGTQDLEIVKVDVDSVTKNKDMLGNSSDIKVEIELNFQPEDVEKTEGSETYSFKNGDKSKCPHCLKLISDESWTRRKHVSDEVDADVTDVSGVKFLVWFDISIEGRAADEEDCGGRVHFGFDDDTFPREVGDFFLLMEDECLLPHSCAGRIMAMLFSMRDKVLNNLSDDSPNVIDLLDKYGDAHVSDCGWRRV